MPNKSQNLEEEGQEVEDNMSLGIHPLTTLKLTQSLIQNLAFGSSWMTKKVSLLATCSFPAHTCTAVNTERETPTLSQI